MYFLFLVFFLKKEEWTMPKLHFSQLNSQDSNSSAQLNKVDIEEYLADTSLYLSLRVLLVFKNTNVLHLS